MINRELIRAKVVQLVYAQRQNGSKTTDDAEKELDVSLGKAYELYKTLLYLLTEVHKYAIRKLEAVNTAAERKGICPERMPAAEALANNALLKQLTENDTIAEFRKSHGIWEEEIVLVKNLFTIMAESEVMTTYLESGVKSYEADRELIRKLYKKLWCDNEELDEVLEEHCIYWNDDRHVIDSYITKTIKRYREDSTPQYELLPAFSSELDKEFAHQLFRAAISHQDEINQIISDNLKGWESGRMALMDYVIVHVAIAEILEIESIPANVTINEYINIAKVYCTPQSGGFVNGLLDHTVKKLREEGVIVK